MKSMKSLLRGPIFYAASLMPLALGCADRNQSINEYVESLGKLEIEAPRSVTTPESQDEPSESPSGFTLLCDKQTVDEVKLFDSFAAQGSVAKTIYPGALLDGDSLASGVFNEIPLPKSPLTLSSNLSQGAGVAVMEEPSLSSFLQARDQMLLPVLEAGEPSPPKFVKVEEIATTSEAQLSLALGFDVSAGLVTNVDVAGQFNFEDTTKRSRYLVKIVNELYTIAADKPAFAADYFSPEVTPEDVAASFQEGNPPVYVDSVTYGRVIYIAVESSFSASELEAALEASLDAAVIDASAEFNLTKEQVLNESSIKAIAIGGTAADQADFGNLKDPAALRRIAERQVSATPTFLGEPISFTVAYLTDNTKTQSNVSGLFNTENCTLAPDLAEPTNFQVGVDRMVVKTAADGDDSAEIRGTISVVFGGDRVDLFNRAEGNEFSFRQGTTVDGSGPFLGGVLNDVESQSGQDIIVELRLAENDEGDNSDEVLSQNITIPVAEILDGEVTIPIVGADLNAELVIDFVKQ